MKIKINKNLIENVVINAIPFLEKKDASSITSHIIITAKNNNLELKATDYEIGFKYNIKNIEIQEEGNVTINGKKFLEILKSLANKEIDLNSDENYLNIKQNKVKFKIQNFNHIEFPHFPSFENKNYLDVNALILSKGFKKIYPAIDINNPKPELNGALIDIKDNYINLVGTDTRRLAVYSYNLEKTSNEFKLILPKKAINEMQKLFLYENESKIEIYYDENILIAKNSNFEFFTKLINGNYPNYEAVMPKEFDFSFKINKEEFLNAIKTISIMGEKIQVTFQEDKMLFESLNSNNNEANDEIAGNFDIKENVTIIFKNKHVVDFLTSIEEEEFIFNLNKKPSAFLVASQNLKTIIMPMNE